MRRTLTAAACGGLTMLAMATPALAEPGVVPTKATNYAAGDMSGPQLTAKYLLASVGVKSGGKKVDIYFRDATGPDNPCFHTTSGGTTATVTKNGTFSATVPLGALGSAKPGSVTVKGEFVEAEDFGVVVSMTARSKVTRGSDGKLCDSGSVDLVGIDPNKGVSGEVAKKGAYVGLLAAKSTLVPVKLPIFFKLSSNGKALDTAASNLELKCKSGKTANYGIVSVTKDALTGNTLKAQDSTILTGTASREIVVSLFNATFGSAKVTGTFQLQSTIQDAAGTTTTDTCDSGAVKYTATRVE